MIVMLKLILLLCSIDQYASSGLRIGTMHVNRYDSRSAQQASIVSTLRSLIIRFDILHLTTQSVPAQQLLTAISSAVQLYGYDVVHLLRVTNSFFIYHRFRLQLVLCLDSSRAAADWSYTAIVCTFEVRVHWRHPRFTHIGFNLNFANRTTGYWRHLYDRVIVPVMQCDRRHPLILSGNLNPSASPAIYSLDLLTEGFTEFKYVLDSSTGQLYFHESLIVFYGSMVDSVEAGRGQMLALSTRNGVDRNRLLSNRLALRSLIDYNILALFTDMANVNVTCVKRNLFFSLQQDYRDIMAWGSSGRTVFPYPA